MSISRRDFMKLVGVSISSLLLTNCNVTPTPTCYAPIAPSPSPTPADPKSRLRQYWLSFGELAKRTQDAAVSGSSEDEFGQELSQNHRKDLDVLIAAGSLSPSVASLVQEAYDAAVYHVWRSNAAMTCYEPMPVNYTPTSASILVKQADALNQFAAQGTIDPQTLENARKAIEHDMAYIQLSEDEVNALVQRITEEWFNQGKGAPEFGELDLAVTPDAQAATQFIIDLLTEK